ALGGGKYAEARKAGGQERAAQALAGREMGHVQFLCSEVGARTCRSGPAGYAPRAERGWLSIALAMCPGLLARASRLGLRADGVARAGTCWSAGTAAHSGRRAARRAQAQQPAQRAALRPAL